jgi:hypothetical protein
MAFFGKKNLFAQLQFNETVAETVYDNIKELYNNPDQRGAIVEYKDGDKTNYVIIAMLADDLEAAFGKKYKKNEEVGSFSASINDGLIQAVLVEGDFESGTLALIPTTDTLADMTEWSFIEKTPMHIAVVTPDFNAEDGVILLSDTVTLNELTNIRNGHMTIKIKNDEDGEPDEAEIINLHEVKDEPVSRVEEDVDTTEESDYDPDVEDVEPEPDVVDKPVEEVYYDEPEQEEYMEPHYEEPVYEEQPVFDPEQGYDPQESVVEPVPVEQPDVQNLVDIQEELLKQLNSDALDINVSDEEFYNVFGQDKHPVELFNEQPNDPNNHLDQHVAQMASVANTKLLRYLDEKTNSLASEYLLALRTYADKLTKTLDYHDDNTEAGRKYQEIKDKRDELIVNEIKNHELKQQEIQDEYDARKEKFIEERKLQAEREFDDENRAQLVKDLELDMAKLELDGQDYEARNLKDLHTRRRDVARVFMERATTNLLMHYRDEMAKVYKGAKELAQAEGDNINRYIEQNFASEVMRANAIQKQMDMQADLTALQDKFNATLAEKNAELLAVREKATADYKALEEKSTFDLREIKQDLQSELDAERVVNKELRASLDRMAEKFETLDEKKEDEYRHRLKVADDRAEALERRLDTREKDIVSANRNRWIVATLLALATAIGGVMVTAYVMNQTQATTNHTNESQITQLKHDLEEAKKDAESAKTEAHNAKSESHTKQAQIDSLTKVLSDRANQNSGQDNTATP